MIDHYQTLGITEQASQAEIKAAFKKLAVQFHPDKHGGLPAMEERFKEINEAYQVLSNPYEKARYDLARKFGQATTPHSPYDEPPSRPYRRPSRPFVSPEINWKENWIATAYAFGFTFLMAAIVMSGIGIKDYVDNMRLEEKMAQRRSQFEKVKDSYAHGQVEAALTSLNDLGFFRDGEQDMKAFKEHLYVDFLDKAERNYRSGVYEDAIYYFELIRDYGPRTTYILQQHLADAYHQTGNLENSIQIYNELLVTKYSLLDSYMALAFIYHLDLHQPHEALKYYEQANEQAIKMYQTLYGNAYPLVLNSRVIPQEHYLLYTGLAKAYLETGNPERAVKATKWNISIWSDSMDNYLSAAEGFHQIGQSRQACLMLDEAKRLGYLGELGFECP